MITANIVADSLSEKGVRLLTFELQYPRCIHGEVMTHRVFSRNAMSSRAVPVAKMIAQVRDDPFVPQVWGMNQAGMQASAVADEETEFKARCAWLLAAENACQTAEYLNELGLHKQIVNRLLEPFQWMRTIVTATEWENFFSLRDHPAAEPHFQRLAKAMREAAEKSNPTIRGMDSGPSQMWHLPYIRDEERQKFESQRQLAKISAARCARVSYLTHDGRVPDVEEDLKLYERLAGSAPIHASPLEHQAYAYYDPKHWSGNLRGWIQFRKLVE